MKKPALLLACALLAGCEGTPTDLNYKTIVGGASAAACAVGGYLLGRDTQLGGANSALLGGLACGLIGTAIGQVLDERELEQAAEAKQRALQTGEPQYWESETTEIVGTSRVVEGNIQVADRPGARCAKTVDEVTLPDGSVERVTSTSCLGGDGAWETI